MMNMHKLGTVSPAAQLFNKPIKSSAIKYLRLIRYTLCVIKDKARRYNSQNGWGFYIHVFVDLRYAIHFLTSLLHYYKVC